MKGDKLGWTERICNYYRQSEYRLKKCKEKNKEGNRIRKREVIEIEREKVCSKTGNRKRNVKGFKEIENEINKRIEGLNDRLLSYRVRLTCNMCLLSNQKI